MSQILFRAKRKDNGEWVTGDLLRETTLTEEIITRIYEAKAHGTYIKYEVDPETVCRYIGLNDENGKRIFEGDIVGYMDTYSTDNGYAESDCIGKVIWDKEELCFHVTERLSAESWEVLQECVVIGNIYDNPELLEEG